MRPRPEPRLPAALRGAFAAALAAYLALAAWLVWRTSILEPYSDMFDWIARWRRLQADGDLGRYLWAPHNFHHMAWTFAILDLDIRVFGGQGGLFLAAGVLALAATAAMLAGAAAAAAGPGLRLVGAGGALALSAMGCDVLDASADLNTTYLHALAFAIAAIVLAQAPGGRPPVRRGAALACAVASGLGNAAGLAVWPALLLVAWREGNRRWVLTLLAIGGGFGALYLLGQAGPSPGGPGGVHLSEMVALFIDDLGLPWVRGVGEGGWLIGLVVLGLSLAGLAQKGHPDAAWPERTATGLILFSLTTAAMVALARTGGAVPGLAPMRYAVFMIPLHVGLWMLALPWVRRAWERWPRRVAGGLAAAAMVMLVQQAVMAVYAVRTGDTNLRVVADFRAGLRRPPMLVTIGPDLAADAALSAWLRAQGLYQTELRPDPPPGQRIGYFGFSD